jgi:hypothetical protein
MLIAGIIAGAVVFLNVLFFISSYFYFAKSAVDPNAARIAFATFSIIVALATYAASVAPRVTGHVLAALLAAAALVGAIAGFAAGKPPVMGMTLLVLAALTPLLAWGSWQRSRPSWAFLVSIVAVLAAVTFFGAPKIRNLLHVGLWYAMIVPGLLIVGVIALSLVREHYRER